MGRDSVLMLCILFLPIMVTVQADVSVGGSLCIDLDVRDAAFSLGDPVAVWSNDGTLAGSFQAVSGKTPVAEMTGGVPAITFRGDGDADWMVLKEAEGTDQWIMADTFSPGGWHHVAVTLQGATGILYLDGTEVGRHDSIIHLPISLGETTQNYLGDSQFSTDPLFKGEIDDFRVYNRALEAAEIDCIANGNQGNQGDLNCNREINLTDFSILASQWLAQPKRPSADISPMELDGDVNLLDLIQLMEDWLLVN